jgi:hypothetical protein
MISWIYGYAFVIGLSSSFHCIGMCGPIAMAVPVQRTSFYKTLYGVLLYNLGRILSYSLIGLLVGFIGLTANLIGILQILSILTGIIILIVAWNKSLLNKVGVKLSFNAILSKAMGKVMHIKSNNRVALFGLINGLLPCGMVYLGLSNALITGSPTYSAIAMAIFGLGTLPLMLFVTWSAHKVSQEIRNKLNKFLPILLTLVGLSLILRGLNLGIPYLSPKFDWKNPHEVQLEDCHAPMTKPVE